MKKVLLSALLAVFVFSACKKKEDTPTTVTPKDSTVSKYNALTTDRWKITEVRMSRNDTLIVDYYSEMKECEKDNFITFNKTGSISSDEGATKCDPSVDQVTTDGSWSLNTDTTQFTIKDSKVLPISGTATAKVLLISNTDFKISKDTSLVFPGVGTISGTIFASFKKVK